MWLPLADTVWNSAISIDKGHMLRIRKLLDVVNNTEGGICNVTIDMIR